MAEGQRGVSAAVAADAQRDPKVREIRIARADSGSDVFVLIIEVRDGHVQGLLCDEACRFATETDALLEPSTTGFLRRLLVHGDVSAAILNRRLSAPIGRIEPHLVERITLRGQGLDFNSGDLGRGTAIPGESDPRWEAKLERHRQIRAVRARASELGLEIYKLGPRED
jgi:hypothetical protein